MHIADLITKGQHYVGDHSTTILTTMGVSGTITTAYLSGKAAIKAHQVLEREQGLLDQQPGFRQLTPVEKVQLTWPIYIPPVVMGATTITSIIWANQLASKKIAALAVASGISERVLQEYKAKVIEKIGENKAVAIRDEIAQDRVNKTPVDNGREVIVTGAGEVLCFDQMTGRYFFSTVEEIRQAQNNVNQDIIQHMYASLSSFYDEIGLTPTTFSDDVGWNSNDLLEVVFSTVMSTDNRPCVAIDFEPPPKAEYTTLY